MEGTSFAQWTAGLGLFVGIVLGVVGALIVGWPALLLALMPGIRTVVEWRRGVL